MNSDKTMAMEVAKALLNMTTTELDAVKAALADCPGALALVVLAEGLRAGKD